MSILTHTVTKTKNSHKLALQSTINKVIKANIEDIIHINEVIISVSKVENHSFW